MIATNLPELNIESFHETPHGKLGSWIRNPGEGTMCYPLKWRHLSLGYWTIHDCFFLLITCKAPQHVLEVRTWRWCSLCKGKREYLKNFYPSRRKGTFKGIFYEFLKSIKRKAKALSSSFHSQSSACTIIIPTMKGSCWFIFAAVYGA